MKTKVLLFVLPLLLTGCITPKSKKSSGGSVDPSSQSASSSSSEIPSSKLKETLYDRLDSTNITFDYGVSREGVSSYEQTYKIADDKIIMITHSGELHMEAYAAKVGTKFRQYYQNDSEWTYKDSIYDISKLSFLGIYSAQQNNEEVFTSLTQKATLNSDGYYEVNILPFKANSIIYLNSFDGYTCDQETFDYCYKNVRFKIENDKLVSYEYETPSVRVDTDYSTMKITIVVSTTEFVRYTMTNFRDQGSTVVEFPF